MTRIDRRARNRNGSSAARTAHAANGHAVANGDHAGQNGSAGGDPRADVDHGRGKRRATAESMAAKQRDISVSEFFAKNRHLLGFDNPRKALLTTVKEAVDNSLDACEEAGIVPEIWVAHRSHRQQPLQGQRAGQRPGHRQKADSADLRQAALRQQVPPPADEPRPAGHRHLGRRHVRHAHDRQAGEDHQQALAEEAGPLFRAADRHQAEPCRRSSTARAKESIFAAGEKGHEQMLKARHRLGDALSGRRRAKSRRRSKAARA